MVVFPAGGILPMTKTSREIRLTQQERHELTTFTGSGKRSAKLLKRAEIILALDASENRSPATEADIAGRIGVSRQTIQNVKKAFLLSRDRTVFYRVRNGRLHRSLWMAWKPRI